MKFSWSNVVTGFQLVWVRSLVFSIFVLLTLGFGMARPVSAQTCPPSNLGDTCPVTGTAKFETGLHNLAFVKLDKGGQYGDGARIYWGDRSETPGLLRCYEPKLYPHRCHVFGTHRYAVPGTYTIQIKYNEPQLIGTGPEDTVTTKATISPIGDFVILTIGDSIASGEGNPVVQFGGLVGSQPNQGFWDDPASDGQSTNAGDDLFGPCHRSSAGGFGLAGNYLVATNPASRITFINYSCSGAKVSKVISMLRSARSILPRIDVLTMAVGADNIAGGFGSLVARCADPLTQGDCSAGTSFAQNVGDSIAELPALYSQLADSINCVKDGTLPSNCSDPQAPQIPKVVFITQYHDPTHNQYGIYPPIGTCLEDISYATWQWLHDAVMVPLNGQVDATSWIHVDGIENDFLRHGYCAKSERWVVTLPDSFATQGDKEGTGHPNASGQTDYKDRILAQIIKFNPPETAASATTDGNPYAFGTWTTHDVTVSLSARNPIGQAGVGDTYYAVDNPPCSDQDPGDCSYYTSPFTISTSGRHTIYFFSSNADGALEKVQTKQVLVDNQPPVMTCAATPSALWPPNNKMVPVTLNVTAVSAAFGPTPFVLKSVMASELPVARVQGFVIGQASTQGSLRASRLGYGSNGQVYTFVYQSTDQLGLTGTCTANVLVPHDQRRSSR
jgi:hypothetical protein